MKANFEAQIPLTLDELQQWWTVINASEPILDSNTSSYYQWEMKLVDGRNYNITGMRNHQNGNFDGLARITDD